MLQRLKHFGRKKKVVSDSTVTHTSENNVSSSEAECYEKCWRSYKKYGDDFWSKETEKQLQEEIKESKDHINILFVGQIRSGKSSTINSLMSVANGRITERAKAGCAEKSLTIQFNAIAGEGFLEKVTLCDLMGLELAKGEGLQNDDIISAANGEVLPGQTLNPAQAQKPCEAEDNRKIQCVIYIVDGENIKNGMPSEFKTKIAEIEAKLHIGPNRVVFVTKIDQICTKVREDLTTVFHSKNVNEAVEKASLLVGVQKNKVFPVKNYVDEVETDTNSNILLLLALKTAICMGVDFVKGQQQDNRRKNNP